MAALELDTSAGPAWKPLPVLVTTLLAPLGDAAPALWLLLARAGGLLAVALAFRLAARLVRGHGRWLAGATAVLGLLATVGFVRGSALGSSEGVLVALVLLACDRRLDERHGQAFALGVAAALLRPEVWPFLALYAVWLWRRELLSWAALLAAPALVLLLWFLPELWGSGDLLRSSERARVPNPGAPALDERPALAVVELFLSMLVLPVAVAALTTAVLAVRKRERATLALVLGAVGWVGLVAVLSEAGFSGEERYLLPAAALAAVVAGSGAGRLYGTARERWSPRLVVPAALALVAGAVAFALPAAGELADELSYAAELRRDLAVAVEHAGGSEALLGCGPLYAGRSRFPLVAWHVDAHISELDLEPRAPGVVFRSRLSAEDSPAPAVPGGFRLLARAGAWEVHAACGASR